MDVRPLQNSISTFWQSVWAALRTHANAWAALRVPAHGLAVFRIAFCLVLLAEVCQIFYFRRLIFDLLPYIQPNEVTPTPLHTDAHMDALTAALSELWAECPMSVQIRQAAQ